MINPNMVEELAVGSLQYRRYALESPILGQKTQFGRVVPDSFETFQPERTLYLFHAGNGDDRQPIQEGFIASLKPTVIEKLRHQKIQIVLPFIATSFLHDYPGVSGRAYARQFFEELLPLVESKLPSDARRFVGGFSMGGFAALSAFLRRPELFTGVLAQMPALISFHFTESTEVESFVQRTKTPPEAIQFLLSLLKAEFVSEADFETANPLSLAAKVPASMLDNKRIRFDVGSLDSFGCFEGADQLHRVLSDRGVKHHYEKVEGGLHDPAFILNRFSDQLEQLLA